MPLLARRAASATERTLLYFRMNMYIRPPMRLSSSPTHQSISGRCWTRACFRDGSVASVWHPPMTSGLPSISGQFPGRLACRKRANTGSHADPLSAISRQSGAAESVLRVGYRLLVPLFHRRQFRNPWLRRAEPVLIARCEFVALTNSADTEHDHPGAITD
jgi:hypothetical protein